MKSFSALTHAHPAPAAAHFFGGGPNSRPKCLLLLVRLNNEAEPTDLSHTGRDLKLIKSLDQTSVSEEEAARADISYVCVAKLGPEPFGAFLRQAVLLLCTKALKARPINWATKEGKKMSKTRFI